VAVAVAVAILILEHRVMFDDGYAVYDGGESVLSYSWMISNGYDRR